MEIKVWKGKKSYKLQAFSTDLLTHTETEKESGNGRSRTEGDGE